MATKISEYDVSIDIKNNSLIYFKAENPGNFKVIFDVIKNITGGEATMIFFPKTADKEGYIEFKDVCRGNAIIYDFKIPSCNLKEYYCQYNKNESNGQHIIHIDIDTICKLFKIMIDCKDFSFNIPVYNQSQLNIRSTNNTHEINAIVKIINNSDKKIPSLSIKYTVSININSLNFRKVCKDLVNFGDYLKISCKKTSVTFNVLKSNNAICYCDQIFNMIGDKNDNDVSIKFDPKYLAEVKNPMIVSQYEIKLIEQFQKLSNLTKKVQIKLGVNNMPISLTYDIPNIGKFITFITAYIEKK